jgi:hypothetical protein
MSNSELTQEYLKSLLEYDQETGILIWKEIRYPKKEMAGHKNYKGYIDVKIDQKIYPAHRLAWLYMKGTWPSNHIDHINLDRSDNRWINLRECSYSQNYANQKVRKNNKSGLKGVSLEKVTGKYRAVICIEKKQINLGLFKTPEEAAKAYDAKAKELFGEFARTNF